MVDIDFYDRYDNIISAEINDTFSNAVLVQLQYATRTAKRTVTLNKSLIPGKVMLYLSEADNAWFKQLPPRVGTQYLEITVPKQEACFTLEKSVR